jgi:hypothetical protein
MAYIILQFILFIISNTISPLSQIASYEKRISVTVYFQPQFSIVTMSLGMLNINAHIYVCIYEGAGDAGAPFVSETSMPCSAAVLSLSLRLAKLSVHTDNGISLPHCRPKAPLECQPKER